MVLEVQGHQKWPAEVLEAEAAQIHQQRIVAVVVAAEAAVVGEPEEPALRMLTPQNWEDSVQQL